MGANLGGSILAVGLGEPLERSRLARTWYSCGPTVSSTSVASRLPTWADRSQDRPHVARGEEAGPEPVADAGRVELGVLLGDRHVQRGRRRGRRSRRPREPSVVTRTSTRCHDLGLGQPVLDSSRLFSYSLVNSSSAPSIKRDAARSPAIRAICCDGSAANAEAALAALGAVPDHRGRVVGADHHQVGAGRVPRAGASSIIAGLAHRAGVERRDLAHLLVGRADEAGGVVVGETCTSRSRRRVASASCGSRRSRRRPRRAAPARRRAAPCRTRCWPRRRRAGRPGRRPGRTATPCAADRRAAARRTCPGKCIRWSVAIEPADEDGHGRHGTQCAATDAELRPLSRQPRPEPVARLAAEGVAAGAAAAGVRVVDGEALLLDRVGEVDRGAAQVRRAHPVDDHRHAAAGRARGRRRGVRSSKNSWYCRPEQPPGCTATRSRRSSRPSWSSSARTLTAAVSVNEMDSGHRGSGQLDRSGRLRGGHRSPRKGQATATCCCDQRCAVRLHATRPGIVQAAGQARRISAPSTRIATACRPDVAGPLMSEPSAAKVEPWHGQWKPLDPETNITGQP